MKKPNMENFQNHMIGAGNLEVISRYGNAGAEFLKGLRGIDHETGQVLDRGLRQINGYKVNSEHYDKNIKQQAGFAAEVAAVSKKNAENIIKGNQTKTFRSEDFPGYGKNHPTVDIVEISDAGVLTSQMKFVTNNENLLKKIALGEGGGKNDYSRYLDVDKLEVPSEQVESMKKTCRQNAEKLSLQAKNRRNAGEIEVADKLDKQAANYKKLETKIADSGVTTEEAIAYRLNPNLETFKDITSNSNRAGIEGAKFGGAIGGAISAIVNIYAVCSNDKELSAALVDTAKDTLAAGGVGYATAFVGSGMKSLMQQSGNQVCAQLSKTGLPGMIISSCLTTSKSIYKYTNGEIDSDELINEIGAMGASMVSGSMFTVIGQIAIPVPILGGLIGGMVGYLVSNHFYDGFVSTLKEAKISKENRILIEMKCSAAKHLANQYQTAIEDFFDSKITELSNIKGDLLFLLNNPEINEDIFCQQINNIAENFGGRLTYKNRSEFEHEMLFSEKIKL